MRYIFRLEGPQSSRTVPCYETGRGMEGAYFAGIAYLDGIRGDYYGSDHPCPSSIQVKRQGKMVSLRSVMKRDEYFGFSSLETARRWWYHREDLEVAQASGYRLVLIPREDVGSIRDLGCQITYQPKPWGKGDCPVIRRVYVAATQIHESSQEELEQWADEILAERMEAQDLKLAA